MNQTTNTNVSNISIFTFPFNLVPFPHAKSHLVVASLWSLILPKKTFGNMVPFIDVVLGL